MKWRSRVRKVLVVQTDPMAVVTAMLVLLLLWTPRPRLGASTNQASERMGCWPRTSDKGHEAPNTTLARDQWYDQNLYLAN